MINIEKCISILVGVPEIDCEHVELITLINLINKYSTTKELRSQVPNLVAIFAAKLIAHFHSEEVELSRLNYKFIDEHKLAHERLIDESIEMLKTKEPINTEVVKMFEQMLINHIVEYDVKAFNYALQEKKD